MPGIVDNRDFQHAHLSLTVRYRKLCTKFLSRKRLNCQQKTEIRASRASTVNGILTVQMNRISGVLLGIDAEFSHPREERGAIQAHAGGSAVGSPNASVAFSERAHNLVTLFLVARVSNAICATERLDRFLHNARNIF